MGRHSLRGMVNCSNMHSTNFNLNVDSAKLNQLNLINYREQRILCQNKNAYRDDYLTIPGKLSYVPLGFEGNQEPLDSVTCVKG